MHLSYFSNGTEVTFEDIMAENFSKLMEDIKPPFKEAEYVPNRICKKKSICRHIIVRKTKVIPWITLKQAS